MTRSISIESYAPGGQFESMPNYNRGRYNQPLAFFIKPTGSGPQHNARIKINANYNVSFDINANFSIRFFPTTGAVATHRTGTVSQNDVDGMIKWLEDNRTTFIDFYEGNITAAEFNAKLTASPHP